MDFLTCWWRWRGIDRVGSVSRIHPLGTMNVCTKLCANPFIDLLSMTKISRVYSLGTINVCTKSHGDQSKSSWDNLCLHQLQGIPAWFYYGSTKCPQLLAGIQKAPTVGFWFPIIKSGGVPQGEYKRRSCSEMQYRVNFVYVPLLFPSWGISQFKANNKRKGCSQRRSHLARVFWKVITSGALECNIIQNIHPPHAVLRGEQIRLKALAPPLRGHTHTHWET